MLMGQVERGRKGREREQRQGNCKMRMETKHRKLNGVSFLPVVYSIFI
jgi:hypothetical protein